MHFAFVLKRSFAVALTVVVALSVMAQNSITVKDFTYDENEGTALTLAPEGVKDNNRQKCALIIVHNVDLGGFKFNTGGWTEAESRKIAGKPVLNLWVSPGTKWIEVSNSDANLKPSERYYFSNPVESEKTYHLWLGDIVRTNAGGRQYVKISVDAPGASLFVDEEGNGQFIAWPLKEGRASKSVPMGEYAYKATAPDYHDDFGNFAVNDPNNVVSITLKLSPKFGWLTIPASDDSAGAQIIIDGIEVGTSSLTRHQLASGKHSLQVQKPKFKVFVKEIAVADNQSLTEKIVLEPNFSNVIIECADKEAEIYLLDIDGKPIKQATGTWRAELEPGTYAIEARRDGYKSTMKELEVFAAIGEQHFTLPAPEPIYGSIDVNSDPEGATIFLDGKEMGVTPKILNDVIAIYHELTLRYPNYEDFVQSINIDEGCIAQVYAEMQELDIYPKHLSLCVVDNKGRTLYLTQEHWQRLTNLEKETYEQKGVCLIEEDERFLVRMFDGGKGNWQYACKHGAPKVKQFKLIYKWKNELNQALRIFGGKPMIDSTNNGATYWTSQSKNSEQAWVFCLDNVDGGAGYYTKSSPYLRVRGVDRIPSPKK